MDRPSTLNARALRTRQELEAYESAALAPYAEKSATSRGRDYPSQPHPYRTDFQKDRDRIVYTTAFRRLQYKTQVFVYYEGDYYRTRLTHTNEAAQIARTVARALGANEDLAEAITLAHDVGHSPFGHSGERALDRLMLERMGLDPTDDANGGRGFNHTVQSLRIVEKLERRWSDFGGLNLTWETREGIAKHATKHDEVPLDWLAPYDPDLRPSLEAQVVNFADELTYCAHDLDDGLRSGMIHMDMADLAALALWRSAAAGVVDDDPELSRHRIIRRIVDTLTSDLVQATAATIDEVGPRSPADVRHHPVPLVALSAKMREMQRDLSDFLFTNLYRHWRVVRTSRKAERVLVALFEAFEADYRQLPQQQRDEIERIQPGVRPGTALTGGAYRLICDYLAGMTDRYALQEHRRLYDPYERA